MIKFGQHFIIEQGYARDASESLYPELWNGLQFAFSPAFVFARFWGTSAPPNQQYQDAIGLYYGTPGNAQRSSFHYDDEYGAFFDQDFTDINFVNTNAPFEFLNYALHGAPWTVISDDRAAQFSQDGTVLSYNCPASSGDRVWQFNVVANRRTLAVGGNTVNMSGLDGTDGSWRQIAMAYDGVSTMRYYQDGEYKGEEADSSFGTGNGDTVTNLNFRSRTNGGGFLAREPSGGFYIWNRCLDPSEIFQIANGQNPLMRKALQIRATVPAPSAAFPTAQAVIIG